MTITDRVKVRADDAAMRWLEVTITNRSAEAEVAGVVISCRDVTEQVAAADDLRRRHDLLAESEGLAHVGSWDLDPSRDHAQWSDENWRILGIEPGSAEPGSKTLLRGVHPDDREQVQQALDESATSASPMDVQFRFLRPDGGLRHVRAVARATHRLESGQYRIIGANLDVTAEVNARERLARLGSAVEQATDSVVITDAAGRIEYVNPAFERLSGYARHEVIGENPRILKSGKQPDSFYEAMWAALASGQPWVAEFVNRRKDGGLYETSGIVSPIFDDRGVISGYVAVKRDVTEERRLKARAKRLARERALIAATIRGITASDDPEAMAAAVCRQVASLRGVVMAGFFVFGLDQRAVPLGLVVAGRPDFAPRRVPRQRSQYLRDQAGRGPWIEAWEPRRGIPMPSSSPTWGSAPLPMPRCATPEA